MPDAVTSTAYAGVVDMLVTTMDALFAMFNLQRPVAEQATYI